MPAVLYKEQITKEFQKLYYTEDMLFETGCLEQWRPEIEDIPSAGRFDYAIVSGNKRYVFLNSRNVETGKPLCKATIEEIAKEIAARAGCRNVATVHVYRKTFASREYQRTKDILYVSHRLGHANTAVTEKYYICDDILADCKMANVA